METQPGGIREGADSSASAVTSESVPGKDDLTPIKQTELQLGGVIAKGENVVNEIKRDDLTQHQIQNGTEKVDKESESKVQKESAPVLDSVSQTIHDVAIGVLAPNPVASMKFETDTVVKLKHGTTKKCTRSFVTFQISRIFADSSTWRVSWLQN